MPLWLWVVNSLMFSDVHKSMAKCKTAVTPLLMHWSYCSRSVSHQCMSVTLPTGSLVQVIMACRLFGTWPSPVIKFFHYKLIWLCPNFKMCHLQNGSHFGVAQIWQKTTTFQPLLCLSALKRSIFLPGYWSHGGSLPYLQSYTIPVITCIYSAY